MEKRCREYLRHLEKLDYDVISEEEIIEEKKELKAKVREISQAKIRLLIPMMSLIICACIFLAAAFNTFSVPNFICTAVMALMAAFFGFKYNKLNDVVKKLYAFDEKLNIY